MAQDDRQAIRRRRGYWIGLARRRKRLTLDAVAELVGYGATSGSIVSRWESGDRPVPSDRFGRLAQVLDLPADYLVNPPLTDSERLEELARAATALERVDWDREQRAHQAAEDEPGAQPGKRSA